MAEHLSPLDATFLELEQQDASAHMHIGSLLVFDGDVPGIDRLRDHLGERLGALPRYRQRLSDPVVHGLTWPAWEDDGGFRLSEHVTRAALPAPGGGDELFAWLSDYWSQRLDRHRPLWDMVLLEGLEGGRWALANRTHHCMVDGVGSVDVGYAMLDVTPEPAGPPAAPPPPEPEPHRLRSAVGHVLDPRSLPGLLARSRAAAEVLVRDEVIPAPPSSLNRPIGTLRTVVALEVDLDELRSIRERLGGTVNDVVLTVVTGGLRSLLLYRGEVPPHRGLRAMVPMNLREASQRLGLGNRVTSLFAHLPVAEADPGRRYERVRAEMGRLKTGHEAAGTQAVIDLAALMPPLLHATVARTLFATRLFNVTVTNVPGPPMTLYGLGSRLREIYGLVPIAADHALGVCILSYDGRLTFTVNADRDTVPDVGVLRAGMEESLAELRELAASGAVAW